MYYILSLDISAIFFEELKNGEPEFRNSDLQLGLASLEKVFLNIARRAKLESATAARTMVTLDLESSISVNVAGTVKLSNTLSLKFVLFIPNFKFNLLSISALTRNSTITVLFSSDACYILPFNHFLSQAHTLDSMIGKGNLHENLYILESSFLKSTSSSSVIPSQIHSTFQISAEVWHQRLGHPSPNKIHILSKELYILSEKSTHESVCKVCPFAKQKHISFESSNNMSPFPFDLIHLDIWDHFMNQLMKVTSIF